MKVLDSSKIFKVMATLVAALLLGMVGTAFADDSASLPAYGGPGGSDQGTVDQGTPPGQLVAPTTTGNAGAPAGTPNGNEVLGARAGGGSLPSNTKASAPATAPAAAAAPATAKASHRLVGSLPFTGFDVIVLAMIGLALLGLGFGLRRLVSSPQLS